MTNVRPGGEDKGPGQQDEASALPAFLAAVADEDEAAASSDRALCQAAGTRELTHAYVSAVAEFLGTADREKAAVMMGRAQGLLVAMRWAALAYADREGYREEWRP